MYCISDSIDGSLVGKVTAGDSDVSMSTDGKIQLSTEQGNLLSYSCIHL